METKTVVIKNIEYEVCECCGKPKSGTGKMTGGKAIFVCKDFVRKGQRVPFSDDWLKLCEAVGFKLNCRHRAMLVKETTEDSLFGGKITKKTERKSFFRRLAEAKGSPRIDEEDVLCMMKPKN